MSYVYLIKYVYDRWHILFENWNEMLSFISWYFRPYKLNNLDDENIWADVFHKVGQGALTA